MEMQNHSKLTIDIDTTELTPAQLRAIKTINMLMAHIITTEDEADFFDGTAETMRLCASLVKQSRFCHQDSSIPYGDQALEFAIEALTELMESSSVVKYDN
ncbi:MULTISPECIES: hypothetical protein [Halobacteriovorax]|uniref:Phage gp6-like head-tail connector protein n=1 Tax=Halobacteriovorax vibrionivorans TaxID=2152716 RepID=A0ABY0IIB4_9BACT|nr:MULTISPECIES: hypothetical protein [Halobacteriovorax]AYF45628.1 hypothetical protein BALOs_2634 [Halobacteriovorax sp. BALOs_7]RZF22691.1 hypothetical protein DAY19_02655 [Halobacteriovorax vibrionivorans]TGD46712.1 hypothetical protein EP118_11040 [Halobacteriovorax sp. Y22]